MSGFPVASAGTYTITVGAGGAGALAGNPSNTAAAGGTSSFVSGATNVTATGGAVNNGLTGGAGGSGSATGGTTVAMTASAQNGGAGLTGTCGTTNNWCGGGGGGAGSAGSNAASSGGSGGGGLASSITGSAVTYGGGGGGGSGGADTVSGRTATAGGAGGTGGGGAGGTATPTTNHTAATAGTAGTANTGGGGGGAGYSNYTLSGGSCCSTTDYTQAGGNGGSGIVVVRYALPVPGTPDLAEASDSGSTSDNITSATTLTFTGSAPVGSVVQLQVALANESGVATAAYANTGSTCTANTSSGAWTCTTATLSPNRYVVRAEAITYLDGATETQNSSTLMFVVDTTAPTVSSFSSSTADGSYRATQQVNVTATVSEAVQSGNTITVTLDTGATVTLTAASAGTSLTGTYTIGAGQNSSDLTVSSFSIGTVADTAGNAMTSTVVPTGTNNIAGAKAIVVDTTAPTVSNVTSSTENGTVSVGAAVAIQIQFSEAVTVTTSGGTPRLTLETGSTDRTAAYASGSGTTTLVFNYTVQAGDASSDLDYASTTALELNGGTIADGAGNSATLTLPAPGASGSLGANKALVVTSSPTKVISVRTPIGTASGAAFVTQPQVSLQDVGSNVVTTDSSTIVTATVSAGASLVGTTTATVVNGVATFSNLGISGSAGTAYTITYSASYGGSALTVATQSVTPTVGAATRLAITTQPGGGAAGASLAVQPVIAVQDSGGNTVTDATVQVTVTRSGGTLGGTTSINAVSGVATFANLTFAGTTNTDYTLTFSSSPLTGATSDSFRVTVGTATQLVLTTSASGATYGNAFTTQPVVEIRDAGGNKVSTATDTVTATLSSGTVVGTGNSVAVAGVATFSGLGITGTPGTFTVTYSSGSLTAATQSISVGKAAQTVTFADPSDRAWSASSFAVSPSSTSLLTVSLASSDANICTVSGFNITMVTVGTCTLTASQAGNDNFNAATSVVQSFVISQASQTITFTDPADRPWSSTAFTLAPTASSSLTVTLTSSTTLVCTVSGFDVTMLKAGTCTLVAAQSGDTKYSAATSVTQSFEIAKIAQASLTVTTTSVDFGSTLSLATSGGTGTGAVSFAVTTAGTAGCSVSGSTLSVSSAGSCTVTATKAADDQYNLVSSS
ncbi:MAG: beta strand repeat-containing protein, partial [Actinomycetota bacterium]